MMSRYLGYPVPVTVFHDPVYICIPVAENKSLSAPDLRTIHDHKRVHRNLYPIPLRIYWRGKCERLSGSRGRGQRAKEKANKSSVSRDWLDRNPASFTPHTKNGLMYMRTIRGSER